MRDENTNSNRTTRRSLLKKSAVAAATITTTGIAGCFYPAGSDEPQGGSRVPLGGDIAAGGVGSGFAYEEPAITQQQATHTVRTADQLDAALDAGTASRPAIAWIPPDGAIDYTGRSREVTHATIASTRSTSHAGGLLYSNSMGNSSAAYRGGSVTGVLDFGEGAAMTGVRYRGPTSAVWDSEWYPGFIPYGSGGASARASFREQRFARGIRISHGSARVDNCEIFGWATQGISVGCPRSWDRSQEQSYPRIRNCSIHDCGLSGYGYGVEVDTGHPVIERCYFNGCRHMIAGEGYPDCGYTLSECFMGPAGSLFPIDMHYLGENIDGSSDPGDYRYRYHSGGLIRVLNTTVAFSRVIDIAESSSISAGGNPFAGNQTSAIVIGGLPAEGVVIQGNQFVHDSPSSAISQSNIPGHVSTDNNGFARFDVSGNTYGIRPNFPVGQP